MNLEELGWNAAFAAHFESFSGQNLCPARVVREERLSYEVLGECGPLRASIAGRLRHQADAAAELPAVGDWVAIEPRASEGAATIHAVLPRSSAFTRRAAGTAGDEQVAAANVDHIFLVSGLDGDFNPRRIERYVTVAWNSGATPVVVLNKADVCGDVAAALGEIEAVAPGVPIHALSAAKRSGMDSLDAYLQRGRTVALLGSSGVGTSTLVNALLESDVQRTKSVRCGDDHGRHTTTHRELFVLPGGGMIIDTPGMRELQLWSDDGDGLDSSFADVAALAERCRFRDCGHDGEPGCAIRAALEQGTLDAGRLASHRKLQRELRYAELRNDQSAQLIQKAKWRKVHKAYRKRTKMMKKRGKF